MYIYDYMTMHRTASQAYARWGAGNASSSNVCRPFAAKHGYEAWLWLSPAQTKPSLRNSCVFYSASHSEIAIATHCTLDWTRCCCVASSRETDRPTAGVVLESRRVAYRARGLRRSRAMISSA
mmetsp:Transcript_6942/g.25317  ORF Transcript_6942/g.25317 Transcript_6942/m.25317 type:complete len:123 (+) Transcript_6942:594-962(+)